MIWGLSVSVVVSCDVHRLYAPAEPAEVAAVLYPASDTALTQTVGTTVPLLPSVRAESARGNPVAGVPVIFTTVGPGTSTSYTVTTDARGLATIPAWTLSVIAGENLVTASSRGLPPVTFRAYGTPGLPNTVVKLVGDNQTVKAGERVSIAPVVKVMDAHGNAVSNVSVGFSVISGRSIISRLSGNTDSRGVASLDSWQLLSAGPHVLRVSTNEKFADFSASAFASRLPCGEENILERGKSAEMELTSGSCVNGMGRFFDVMTALTATSGIYRFDMSSTDFESALEIRGAGGAIIGFSDTAPGTTGAHLFAIPPSPASIVIASAKAVATGKYSISFEEPASLTGCEHVFAAPNTKVRRMFIPDDCGGAGIYGHRYQIFLNAGQTVSISVTDQTYSWWGGQVLDPDGRAILDLADSAPYVISSSLTAPRAGYYSLRIWSYETRAVYELSIQ